MMPYLASLDEHGNTALRPGPLFAFVPLESVAQGGKYWLAEQGLRYTLEQSFSGIGMSDVKEGSQSLGFYSLTSRRNGPCSKRPAPALLDGSAPRSRPRAASVVAATPSPRSNFGTLTEANDDWSSVNGVRVPELAWQQSLRDGESVAVAGVVSQRNYLDANA